MSTNPHARAWVEVRADALRDNYRRVQASVGAHVRVIPMVKAEAYGLGMADAVRTLEPEEPWGYGVATAEEGSSLRELGVERAVVVFSPLPAGSVRAALEARLQVTVSSLGALRELGDAAGRAGTVPGVHVEVDTGIGRAGFDWSRASEWLPEVERWAREGRVEWIGCHTHLHSADEGAESVHEQLERFGRVLDLAEPAREGLMVHVLNSAGSFRTPEYARAAVRPGIFLYGGGIGPGQPRPETVASVRARIVHLRDAEPGSTVGYGATHRAVTPERWATLAIGYGDGLPRALGNRGSALVAGVRVPMVGRISMDVTVVDITGVDGVELGDVATLVGRDGEEEITVDEVAELVGTISYEVLTGLTPRLPRVWVGLDE